MGKSQARHTICQIWPISIQFVKFDPSRLNYYNYNSSCIIWSPAATLQQQLQIVHTMTDSILHNKKTHVLTSKKIYMYQFESNFCSLRQVNHNEPFFFENTNWDDDIYDIDNLGKKL